VQHQIKARGQKLRNFTARDIAVAANEYLAGHRQALFEEAIGMVQSSAELRKLYAREQRERQHWLERNSEHSCKAKSPATQTRPLHETHEQNGAPK